MERLSTGVLSLDKLVEGGVPRGFFVAVVGEPGTGKTILCIHYVAQGIMEGDLNIYVTTEESRDSIMNQAKQFGFDFEKAIENKKLILIDALMGDEKWSLKHLDIDELVDIIIQAKKSLGYGRTRLVIDSLSAFWLAKPSMARQYSYTLKKILSKWDLTTLVTSQYAITTSISGDELILIKTEKDLELFSVADLYQKMKNGDLNYDSVKCLSMDKDLKVRLFPVANVSKHIAKEPLYKFYLENNETITVTGDHSIYILKENKVFPIAARNVKKDDFLVGIRRWREYIFTNTCNSIQFEMVNDFYEMDFDSGSKLFLEDFPREVFSSTLNLIGDRVIEPYLNPDKTRISRHELKHFLDSRLIKSLEELADDGFQIESTREKSKLNDFITLFLENGLVKFDDDKIFISSKGTSFLKQLKNLRTLVESDLLFLKVKKIEVLNNHSYVYDLTVHPTQNFAAGLSGILCHNSEAFGFGVEHIADGILRFRKNIRNSVLRRYILVEKMRQTNHSLYLYEVHIMPGKGLVVSSPTYLRREDLVLPNDIKKKIKKHRMDKD